MNLFALSLSTHGKRDMLIAHLINHKLGNVGAQAGAVENDKFVQGDELRRNNVDNNNNSSPSINAASQQEIGGGATAAPELPLLETQSEIPADFTASTFAALNSFLLQSNKRSVDDSGGSPVSVSLY
jgi:hypothetical protein